MEIGGYLEMRWFRKRLPVEFGDCPPEEKKMLIFARKLADKSLPVGTEYVAYEYSPDKWAIISNSDVPPDGNAADSVRYDSLSTKTAEIRQLSDDEDDGDIDTHLPLDQRQALKSALVVGRYVACGVSMIAYVAKLRKEMAAEKTVSEESRYSV
jgi:hypothetical protein